MRPVVRAVLRGSLRQIHHVRATDPGRARGLVAEVYEQAQRDFGVLAPPLALHSPAPPVLAAGWLMLRETLLVEGTVGRTAKEVVATEVSRANSCPYCVSVHQATLDSLSAQPGAPGGALAVWAASTGRKPGRGAPTEPPFPAAQAPELAGTAVTFHYINRMVGLYLDESPVPGQAPGFVRGPIMRTVARSMRPVSGRPLEPGTALELLPAAPLPAALSWARPNPVVAEAMGRAVAAMEGAAHWVPTAVRDRLAERLEEWDGGPVGPSRAWLTEALTGLPHEDRPAARLALLTAFAPYQAVDEDFAAFRTRFPEDRALIELTAWAALSAALCVGSRLAVTPVTR
ncbi:alkylhydroperoxidase [Streptomyces sp. NPDC097619]|uniref:alkylhydroperoxidase n=1 Tax=Streptomyces sp. NPDC097619 TaxID=3157228 RepID=UPI00332B1C9D